MLTFYGYTKQMQKSKIIIFQIVQSDQKLYIVKEILIH